MIKFTLTWERKKEHKKILKKDSRRLVFLCITCTTNPMEQAFYGTRRFTTVFTMACHQTMP